MTKQFTAPEDVIIDDDFLAWYHNTTPEAVAAWNGWIAKNPEYQPLVQQALELITSLELKEKPVAVEQTKNAYDDWVKAVSDTTPVIALKPRHKSRWWMAAAAAVLLLIAGTLLWSGKDTTAYNTQFGQIGQHRLPDGSDVLLNANSKLTVKEWNQTGDREAWLEGEAFFHVRKTSSKSRFIVHANGADIIVTGTRFNVVSRGGVCNVLLKEGKVAVKTAEGKLIQLQPGDFVAVSKSKTLLEKAPEEKVLAWTQAKLVFENTPLSVAAKTITQHYGVKVVVDKGAESKTLSGILPNNNLDVLLQALEALNLSVSKQNGQINIAIKQ